MTTLTSFTPEDAELIVSLPYRVGMNISYSEDESGDLDDELELQALEKTLRAVIQKEESGAFVKDVAKAVLDSKDKWDVWSQGVFNIEPLCEKTIAVLRADAHIDIDETKEYVKMCLDVAVGVAQAYGEFGDDCFGDDEGAGIIGKISSFLSAKKEREAHHPMNVSAAEDSAIERIAQAMKKALEA